MARPGALGPEGVGTIEAPAGRQGLKLTNGLGQVDDEGHRGYRP
jgi:hypothetical protein